MTQLGAPGGDSGDGPGGDRDGQRGSGRDGQGDNGRGGQGDNGRGGQGDNGRGGQGGDGRDWLAQARRGVIELCVLILIGKNPHYGYELAVALSHWKPLAAPEG